MEERREKLFARFANKWWRVALVAAVLVVALPLGPVFFSVVFGHDLSADPFKGIELESDAKEPPVEGNAYVAFCSMTGEIMRAGIKGSPLGHDALVATNAALIARFRALLSKPAWYDTDVRAVILGVESGRRWCNIIESGASMLELGSWQAERQVERGEIAAALEWLRDFARMWRLLREDASSGMYETLTGRCLPWACDMAGMIARAEAASDEDVANVLAVLLEMDDGERRRTWLRRMVANEYRYGAVPVVRELQGGFFRVGGVAEGLRDVCSQVLPMIERDYNYAEWERLEAEIAAKNSPLGLSSWFIEDDSYMDIDQGFLASVSRLVEESAWWDWLLRSTETIVAVELFRRRNGKRPTALAELVPDILPSVPVDPYRPGTPVNYDPERGFVYTVGKYRDFTGENVPAGGIFNIGDFDGHAQPLLRASRVQEPSSP